MDLDFRWMDVSYKQCVNLIKMITCSERLDNATGGLFICKTGSDGPKQMAKCQSIWTTIAVVRPYKFLVRQYNNHNARP